MKKIITLMLLTMTTSAHAANINATFTGSFIAPIENVKLDAHRTEQVLSRYLSKSLGCTNIQLCLTNLVDKKDRIFKVTPGSFTLKLNATCSQNFDHFRFDMRPADDYEDYTDSLVGFTKNGSPVEKDIVARLNGEDYRRASSIISVSGCDSSPIDPELPFHILTNPDQLRHFPSSQQ